MWWGDDVCVWWSEDVYLGGLMFGSLVGVLGHPSPGCFVARLAEVCAKTAVASESRDRLDVTELIRALSMDHTNNNNE